MRILNIQICFHVLIRTINKKEKINRLQCRSFERYNSKKIYKTFNTTNILHLAFVCLAPGIIRYISIYKYVYLFTFFLNKTNKKATRGYIRSHTQTIHSHSKKTCYQVLGLGLRFYQKLFVLQNLGLIQNPLLFLII